MNEPGQHYEPMQDDDGIFMNQCEPGKGYVRATDYERLEQECDRLRALLKRASIYPLNHACETGCFTAQELCEEIDAVLDVTL